MLTTDVALLQDPQYRDIVQQFADSADYFDEQFAAAWYKARPTNIDGKAMTARSKANIIVSPGC